jgi:hexosaminidase
MIRPSMHNPLAHLLRRFRTLPIAAALCISSGAAFAQDAAITPIPAVVQVDASQVLIGSGAHIVVPAGDAAALRAAQWLSGEAAADRTLNLTVTVSGQGAIQFERVDDPTLGEEAYRLDVTAAGVRIRATTDAGLFYGAVSLLQLLTPEDGTRGAVTLKGVHIEDRPRFPWRGLMLDSARHYQSVAFIKALLDQMARYKLNTFHWHLTDDQAWRIEIKRYPRLTSVGAWRVEAGEAHQKDIDPKTGRPRVYGGFYTQGQVREIVAYAKARSITVVPEIEMPGHASAAILAYPELGVRAVDPTTIADWGVFPNLYKLDEKSFTFLENVLTEVMDLFPGPYIHIGGDEAIKDYWRTSPIIQAQIKTLGLKDEDALQSWFIQRIERFLAAHGRHMVGWDEILEGELPQGAIVMSWHGVSGAVAAAKAGHDAILTPGLPFYFDNRQSAAIDEPPGRGLIITLQNVYGFDPTPKTLDAAALRHIKGLQANVWTEHIRLDDRVEHMAFPRAVALAEMAWSPPEKRAWPSFIARLPTAIRRDQALGLQPALSVFKSPKPLGRYRRDNHELALCTDKVTLNLEADGPVNSDHRAVVLTDISNPCWIWKGADLTEIKAISAEVGRSPFNYLFGDQPQIIPLTTPITPDGELAVHLDTCTGPLLTTLSLPPAVGDSALTALRQSIPKTSGLHDLCFIFDRAKLDPIFMLDAVTLDPGPGA